MYIKLLILALAPVAILLAYTIFRDKYEKEPWPVLVVALIFGAVSTLPIILVERILSSAEFLIYETQRVFWDSFIVAAFTEELFKLLFLLMLIWKSPVFNEKFDGIVYAVFVSLGFAAVENIIYVFDYGPSVGMTRALTAIPAHFIFGINMGFFVALAKFYPEKRKRYLRSALFYPLMMHGLYNFILMSNRPWSLIVFLPYIYFLWKYAMKKMKQLSDNSIFRNDYAEENDTQINNPDGHENSQV